MAHCNGKNAKRRKFSPRRATFARVLLLLVAAICLLSVLFCAVACNNKDKTGGDDPVEEPTLPDEEQPDGEHPDDGEEENADPPLKQITDVEFDDATYVYDGRPHSLKARYIPYGAQVKYSLEDLVDAGEYEISVEIKLEGYETLTLTATLTILPATVEVSFPSKTFVWDGEPHSLKIEGDLPYDTVVTYDGNAQTEVGVYTVTAHVELNKNYVPVEDLVATLTIKERTYIVTFVHWDNSEEKFTVARGESFDSNLMPANKSKEGYLSTYWDPKGLERLYKIQSDVFVYELLGEREAHKAIIDPNGGIMHIFDAEYELLGDGRILIYYTADDYIELNAPYHPDGKRFAGWYDENGNRVTHLPDENGPRDMTLTAYWQ